ncbi:MAG: ABC transporter permease [Holophagae bacterium]|jgi:ABC-type polysaccharide/polyol phosphate export permease
MDQATATATSILGRSGSVYDSVEATRRPMRRSLVEVLRYRDFLRLQVVTNIRGRYKRSVLGVAWSLLSPLLTMIVMSIAFSAIFRFSVPNYPVYVLAGLVFFGFFQETTTQSMRSLVFGGSLLKKVYVPAATFPLSSVGTGLVNLGLTLVPIVFIMLVLGHNFTWAFFFVPVGTLLIAVFSLGVGLIMATLAVFFSDVVEMWGVLVRALFYLTPVMYPEEILPERFVWIVTANPLYHLLRCWRDPIYLGTSPPLSSVAVATATSVGVLVIGWWVFCRHSHEFALRA